ncbi:uncharacterized protein B0T23DRAFT_399753 [Neurospora hispaniola]|uniref:Uncharacterized protein n=1 Tax=Neurospora hispaniola TaxID=588809 RepID=A0AAJ0I027_9PEZI|nr:hypothetical protein B0T23DRAFT_399753 [Neurospora hispaniola]
MPPPPRHIPHWRDPQKYLSARPLAELHRPLCTKAFFTGLTPQGENNRPKHNPHEQACHFSEQSMSEPNPSTSRILQNDVRCQVPVPTPSLDSFLLFPQVYSPPCQSESDFALHDPTPTSIPDLTSFSSYIGQDAIRCPISSHSVRATRTKTLNSTSLRSNRPCHGFIMTVHLKAKDYHPLVPSTKAITGRWNTLAITPPRGGYYYYLYESKSMTPLHRQAGHSQIAATTTTTTTTTTTNSSSSIDRSLRSSQCQDYIQQFEPKPSGLALNGPCWVFYWITQFGWFIVSFP